MRSLSFEPSSEPRRRYAGMITGMRRGPDGYALERNTRYADHWGGNKATAALSLEMWGEIQGDTGRHREIRPPCLSRCGGRYREIQGDTGRYGRPVSRDVWGDVGIQGDTAARREGDATPVLAVSAPAAATLAAAALAASPPRCERAGGGAQGPPGRRPAGGRGGALPLCRWRLTHRLTGGPALCSLRRCWPTCCRGGCSTAGSFVRPSRRAPPTPAPSAA